MKKLFYLLLLIFCGSSLFAQPHLRISNISGIPVTGIPNNIVYEVNTYDSINVTIVNDDTTSFSDSLSILIKSGSIQYTDTLVHESLVNIASGDSITLLRSGYIFSPIYFEDGDNIVVVWPAARHLPIQTDSLSFTLFFVSLVANVSNISNEPLILFPNPASKYIYFRGIEEIAIKQVRIYDISGKMIYSNSSIQRYMSIEKWKSGLYFINLEKDDGSVQVISLQKN